MADARRAEREIINRYLRVFDRESDRFLGYLVDITPVGAMLQSREPIEPDARFKLRVELPEGFEGGNAILVEATSRWDKKEDNALFHHTGFQFEAIASEEEAKVRRLMESYKLEGLSH